QNDADFQITSTKSLVYDKDHCMSIWYYEDGESPFSVYLYALMPSQDKVLKFYTSALENRQRWNLIKANVLYDPSYNASSELRRPYFTEFIENIMRILISRHKTSYNLHSNWKPVFNF